LKLISGDDKTRVESSDAEEQAAQLPEALERLNERIARLHASFSSNTAFVLFTGHSNPLPMLALASKRQKWERLLKQVGNIDDIPKEERWMSEDDRQLETAAAEAREGMAFFCVKRA
jgi:RNA exonuclease 1